MWEGLGLNMKRHDELLTALGQFYEGIYLSQTNRPKGMEYFDFVVSEVHGLRIKELLDRKKEGGSVVGTFCVYVPDEIITALNGISVGLCGGAQFSIPDAEEVLPRSICPLIKSAFGFKLGMICPYFESADFLVGETTCDGKKKTWELLNEHIPIYVMETPNTKSDEAKKLWLAEVTKFKDFMEKKTGNKVTADKLNESIKITNARRKALERLYELRKSNPLPISGKDALLISQIAFYDDPPRFTAKVNELCDELKERVEKGIGVFDKKTPRLMISGTPMPVPNWKIHHIAETSGAAIAVEETCTGTRYFTQPEIPENLKTVDEQIQAIAERYLKINCACFTPNDERVADVLSIAKKYDVAAVIYYVLQFCHNYNIEYVKIEKALKENNIPVVRIESDYGEEDIEQVKTRIQGLLEMVS